MPDGKGKEVVVRDGKRIIGEVRDRAESEENQIDFGEESVPQFHRHACIWFCFPALLWEQMYPTDIMGFVNLSLCPPAFSSMKLHSMLYYFMWDF